jgi:excisionase family DNA binding protein
MSQELMYLQEAADYMTVSLRTLRGMRQRGEIPTTWIRPGCPRITKAAADTYIESKTQKPRPQRRKRRRRS